MWLKVMIEENSTKPNYAHELMQEMHKAEGNLSELLHRVESAGSVYLKSLK